MHLAFSPNMLVMGGAFAFMGGISGFCLGAWSLQKERWLAEKLESRQRLVALETLRELMVTLAHYIRNSNIVIGGFSAHLLKNISDVNSAQKLQMIQQASREIEAVINALQNLTEISTVEYTTKGQARMIDLEKELEAHLSRKATEEQHEP
jgi:signal transduction histidine kinase